MIDRWIGGISSTYAERIYKESTGIVGDEFKTLL